MNWLQCRRLKDALDALAIPWTRRNHGAWATEPLTEPQTIAVRSAVAVLRLNAHLGTTLIQAQALDHWRADVDNQKAGSEPVLLGGLAGMHPKLQAQIIHKAHATGRQVVVQP